MKNEKLEELVKQWREGKASAETILVQLDKFLQSFPDGTKTYMCKDCSYPIEGNYVSQHYHCTDVHPDDR